MTSTTEDWVLWLGIVPCCWVIPATSETLDFAGDHWHADAIAVLVASQQLAAPVWLELVWLGNGAISSFVDEQGILWFFGWRLWTCRQPELERDDRTEDEILAIVCSQKPDKTINSGRGAFVALRSARNPVAVTDWPIEVLLPVGPEWRNKLR